MPLDQHWRIADQPVVGHIEAEPTVTLGESYDFRAILTGDADSPAGEWPDAAERKRTLLSYGRRAGSFVLHELEGGRVAYTETHDGTAVPDGTLVVAVRPAYDSESGRGGWYLVEGVEDATTLPDAMHDLTLSLVYLAPLAQTDAEHGYATRAALARDLEADAL